MAQTQDAATTPATPVASASNWSGKITTNLSAAANKWLGRNRPAIGAGALAGVGTAVSTLPKPRPITAGQFSPPAAIPGLSVNPHRGGAGTQLAGVFASSAFQEQSGETPAPANSAFTGVGGIVPYFKPVINP